MKKIVGILLFVALANCGFSQASLLKVEEKEETNAFKYQSALSRLPGEYLLNQTFNERQKNVLFTDLVGVTYLDEKVGFLSASPARIIPAKDGWLFSNLYKDWSIRCDTFGNELFVAIITYCKYDCDKKHFNQLFLKEDKSYLEVASLADNDYSNLHMLVYEKKTKRVFIWCGTDRKKNEERMLSVQPLQPLSCFAKILSVTEKQSQPHRISHAQCHLLSPTR